MHVFGEVEPSRRECGQKTRETVPLEEVARCLLDEDAEEALCFARDEAAMTRHLICEVANTVFSVEEEHFCSMLVQNKPPTFCLGVLLMYDARVYEAILRSALATKRTMWFLCVRQAMQLACMQSLDD